MKVSTIGLIFALVFGIVVVTSAKTTRQILPTKPSQQLPQVLFSNEELLNASVFDPAVQKRTFNAVVEGGSATFQVKLGAPPSAPVNAIVSRLSDDTDISVQSGTTLTFTPTNWDTYQPVTLAAADDADITDGTATIRGSVAGLPDKDVTATESDNDSLTVDILVYGGTSAGVMAAYASKIQGRSVLLVEPSNHLGGMSSGGLSATDIGKIEAITGLAADFYSRVGAKYGVNKPVYFFEPHVAEEVFNDYVSEANVNILLLRRLKSVGMNGSSISSIVLENALNPNPFTDITVEAGVFIDTTYEGDLLALAGVSYTIGRESNVIYNESYNGVQVPPYFHQFPDGISPYIEEGNPASGILPGINPVPLAPQGSGDAKIQAYNYRLCMTTSPSNRLAVPAPTNYKPQNYELLGRLMSQGNFDYLDDIFLIRGLKGAKFDWNNRGPLSTDLIGGSWDYPEASYFERKQIELEHRQWIYGLFKFLVTDSRIPQNIRQEISEWGLCKDEFIDNGSWPYNLYVREARRMIGQYVMTEDDIMGRVSVNDGIAYGSYGMDSHNAQRVIVNGMVKNEGNTWISTPQPYMISFRSMTPDPDECVNLLVPVCLSASHIAFGSIRMEPVFMALGEVAGVAASIAVEDKAEVQEIDVQKILNYLHPKPSVNFVDVPLGYWAEDAIYKIYNVGITKGCSQDPLMFCPNKDVTREQVAAFIVRALEGEPDADYCNTGSPFSDVSPDSFFCKYIKRLSELEITKGCGGDNYCPNNSTTRAEMAAFLIRAVEGEPPADYCDTGSPFSDVSPDSFFCKYIKRLLELEITKGCGPGIYCPDRNVTRAEMAAFLARAFLEMD